jgi:hypothetical protein
VGDKLACEGDEALDPLGLRAEVGVEDGLREAGKEGLERVPTVLVPEESRVP